MNCKKAFVVMVLGLVLVCALNSQSTQTGNLRGVVTSTDRGPLPGVNVTVSGPALMGSQTTQTNQDGAYRIPNLPPGKEYVVVAEIQGFSTTKREGIIIRVGITVTINFEMPLKTLKEEVTVVAPSPPVDVVSTKNVATVPIESINNIPMARDVYNVMRLVPGAVISLAGSPNVSFKGGARNNNAWEIDGVNSNEPRGNYGENYISWETIEEVEIVIGGTGAEVFQGIGGMINVVTKSGGNRFSGQAEAYYTGEKFSKSVVPTEKLKAIGSGVPMVAVADYDLSATLGGSIIKDRIWFLANTRYQMNKRNSNFIPTTIAGVSYDKYNLEMGYAYGFAKISAQPSKNLRLFGMLTIAERNTPVFDMAERRTVNANRWQILNQVTTSFNATWTLTSKTIVEFRGGNWWNNGQNIFTKQADPNGPYFLDQYTRYEWGRGVNQYFGFKRNYQAGAKLTHFMDDFLGADHEMKAGLEIQPASIWAFTPQKNGMRWDYYNGNPYYFRGLYGLNGPHPEFGDGRLYFSNAVAEKGDNPNKDSFNNVQKTRIGMFIQDTISIRNRLNVTLGLRFDTIKAVVPEQTKTAAADDLGRALSKAYIEPVYGVDPFGGGFKWTRQGNAFPYNFLSPSLGIAYDPFGKGKTALKASYGRYANGLPTLYVSTPPSGNQSFQFRWWDLNGNGRPDLPGTDNYQYVPEAPLPNYMLKDDYKDTLDPNIKIPYEHQFMVGIDHELFKDFKLGLNYMYKTRRSEMVSVFYDRATGEYWSFNDSYWVPFRTTVPAYGSFPAVDVTAYFLKADHPEEFYRNTNLPDDKLKHRYHAFELSFNKNFSHGWSLGGSFVYTNLKGNLEYSEGLIQGAFRDPNYSVNRYGDLTFSIPIMIKLFGTVTLPQRIIFSFIFEYLAGTGWGRNVTVEAPLAWRQANNIYQFNPQNLVILEPSGIRRDESSQIFDLRLEKEFSFGRYGRLGVFVDIFNVLGFQSVNASVNPGGTWRPVAENSTEGKLTPSRIGFNSITGGVRTYKFSIRYTF